MTPASDDQKPPYPNVEVPDDTHSLRVVDAAGAPVECRNGDDFFVPATDHLVYILETGNADDLAALLRPAAVNRMPMMEISATPAFIAEGDVKKPALTVRLTNITLDEVGGSLKIVQPPPSEKQPPIVLAQNPIVPVSPGQKPRIDAPARRTTARHPADRRDHHQPRHPANRDPPRAAGTPMILLPHPLNKGTVRPCTAPIILQDIADE